MESTTAAKKEHPISIDGKTLKLSEEVFIPLLKKLIGETEHLQNKPPKFVPEEDRAVRHVLEVLNPHSTKNGGPLELTHIHFDQEKRRGNLIIKYPRQLAPKNLEKNSVVSFVGSHMDVVLADPANWDPSHPPFQLTQEGDLFYGRGTTDCLGHVALITDVFRQLAEQKPKLAVDVFAVFIADEEEGSAQVGVERLCPHEDGATNYLSPMKNGPLLWVDCADKTPNVGTGGVVQWELKAKGKMFHSGFPHRGINAIELVMDSINEIQHDFYAKFPKHSSQTEYGFGCSSSFKPTIVTSPDGSVNQIPGECLVKGDIRLVPFYNIKDAMKCVEETVARINSSKFTNLSSKPPGHGPDAKYSVSAVAGITEAIDGHLTLTWLGPPIQGLACDLKSVGLKSLKQAVQEVVGEVKLVADTGALPLVADLKEQGFDVQTIGFGVEDVYHADNEFLRLSDFKEGFKILLRVVELVNNEQIGETK